MIYQRDSKSHTRWNYVASLREGEKQHDGKVHDIAWAPDMGRSFHLIATAGQDNTVRIWEVRTLGEGGNGGGGGGGGGVHLEVREAACLQCAAEVWRVEWNITGTVLASSGDDGYVRLWRTDVGPEGWTQINQFRSQEPGRD